MSEEKIVAKDILDVEEKTMYEFSLVSWHYGEFTSKGMVFYVKFYDSKDKEVVSRVFRFSSSRAFTNYIYVSTGTKSEPVMKDVSIMTPVKDSIIGVALIITLPIFTLFFTKSSTTLLALLNSSLSF